MEILGFLTAELGFYNPNIRIMRARGNKLSGNFSALLSLAPNLVEVRLGWCQGNVVQLFVYIARNTYLVGLTTFYVLIVSPSSSSIALAIVFTAPFQIPLVSFSTGGKG